MKIYTNDKFKEEFLKTGNNITVSGVKLFYSDFSIGQLDDVLMGKETFDYPYNEDIIPVYSASNDNTIFFQFSLTSKAILETRDCKLLKFYWTYDKESGNEVEGAFLLYNFSENSLKAIPLDHERNIIELTIDNIIRANVSSFDDSDLRFLDISCVFSGSNALNAEGVTMSTDSFYHTQVLEGGRYDNNSVDQSGRQLNIEKRVREYTNLLLNCDDLSVDSDSKKVRYGLSKNVENEWNSLQFSGIATYNEYFVRNNEIIPGTEKVGVTCPLESCPDVSLRLEPLTKTQIAEAKVGDSFDILYRRTKGVVGELSWSIYAKVGDIKSDSIKITTRHKPGALDILTTGNRYLETTVKDKIYRVGSEIPVIIYTAEDSSINTIVKIKYYGSDAWIDSDKLDIIYDTELLDTYENIYYRVEGSTILVYLLRKQNLDLTGNNQWFPTHKGKEWLFPITVMYDSDSCTFCPIIRKYAENSDDLVEITEEGVVNYSISETEQRKYFGLSVSESGATLRNSENMEIDYIDVSEGKQELSINCPYGKSDLLFYLSDRSINYNYDHNIDWRNEVCTTVCRYKYIPTSAIRNITPIDGKLQVDEDGTKYYTINSGIGVYKFKVISPNCPRQLNIQSDTNETGVVHIFHEYNNKYGIVGESKNQLLFSEEAYYKNRFNRTGFIVCMVVSDIPYKTSGSPVTLYFDEDPTKEDSTCKILLKPNDNNLNFARKQDRYCFYNPNEFEPGYVIKKFYIDTECGLDLSSTNLESLGIKLDATPNLIDHGVNYIPEAPIKGNVEVTLSCLDDITSEVEIPEIDLYCSEEGKHLQIIPIKKPTIQEVVCDNDWINENNTENILYISPDRGITWSYDIKYNDSWSNVDLERSMSCRVFSFSKELDIQEIQKEDNTIGLIITNLTGNPNIDTALYVEFSSKETGESVDRERITYNLRTFLSNFYEPYYRLNKVDEWAKLPKEITKKFTETDLITSNYICKLPIYLKLNVWSYSYEDSTFLKDETNLTELYDYKDISNLCSMVANDWKIVVGNNTREVDEYIDNLQFRFETPNGIPCYCLRYSIKENKRAEVFDIVGKITLKLQYPKSSSLPLTSTHTILVSNNKNM